MVMYVFAMRANEIRLKLKNTADTLPRTAYQPIVYYFSSHQGYCSFIELLDINV